MILAKDEGVRRQILLRLVDTSDSDERTHAVHNYAKKSNFHVNFQILVVKGLVKVYNTLQMMFNREFSEDGTHNIKYLNLQ